jgi:hypothetical protein
MARRTKTKSKKKKATSNPVPNNPVPSRIAAVDLHAPKLTAEWFDEPELLFAGDERSVDPKVGIPLYGPRSLGTGRHKREIHVGFIGTAEAVATAQSFLNECADGVAGDDHTSPFPGCKSDRGFRADLRMDTKTHELITRHESQEILQTRRRRDRFERALSLLADKLQVLTTRDHPLDYVLVVLTQEMYRACRAVDYFEKGKGPVHRDLRRAFKAAAMGPGMPATQILLENTTRALADDDDDRDIDHPAVIAWNLFTGLYFKVEGLPWGPTGLPPGSCFVGVSFYRPLGESSTLRTSLVQAFDENGEGLVLRGQPFEWDEEKGGKSPHLSEALAHDLVGQVLQTYQDERQKQLPQRVVLYKTSRFEAGEREGFESALRRVSRFDLVALRPTSDVRLLRNALYPPIRGSAFGVGDLSYLYTTGYIPHLGRYPHGHVPSPLQIADHIGDTPRRELLREILTLSKMNFNSANMHGLMAIPVRFARLVGDILRELPERKEPSPKFKHYI